MDDLTIQASNNVARDAQAAPRLSSQEAEARRRADRPEASEKAPREAESAPQKPLDRAALESLIQQVNETFAKNTSIHFQVSPDSGDLVVQVVDRESDEVIRSIPPERLVEFSKNLGDTSSSGILLDDLA